MKLCKKLFSFILVLSIMLSSVSAFAAPNANESGINEYNLAPGTTVICVEAFVLGWGYVLEPTVVAYNPGETLAQLTARVLAANSLACVMNGAVDDDASYIQGIGCPQHAAGASPSVPAYLMTELEAYPDWAEENLGYQPGGWNGTENGDGILSEFEYSDLGGWMYVENDVSLPVGAGAATVTDNKVYRWMYTVYGYGMDLGIGDGWGMFPEFDNPAYGVTRSSETELYASVLSDPALSAQISEGGAAHAAFTAFESALTDITSSQAVLTAAAEALTNALVPVSVIPGDADGDGVVTASDALLIARHAMQLQILTGSALEAADVDGNGTVALTDALLALRIAING